MADIEAVTARVNAARAACSLPPVAELPKGERHNPCFCPLGRAFRKDTGDSFFVAVGTRHLRLASIDGDAMEVARRIQKAWGGSETRFKREGEGFYTVPLPAELTEFVVEFDAGKLSKFEGPVAEVEKARFKGLARTLWNVTMDRLRRVRLLGRARTPSRAAVPPPGPV